MYKLLGYIRKYQKKELTKVNVWCTICIQVVFGSTFEETARSKEYIFMEEEVVYKSADDFWLGEIPEISFSKMKTL